MTFKEFWAKLWRPRPKDARWAPTNGGLMPWYSQFGTDIYASDVVQQALGCIVNELKKLNPKHVRYIGADPTPVKDSDIQRVLNEPNPLMTTNEFIEKTAWLLLMNYNVFILPTYYRWFDKQGEEHRQYEALWPLKPSSVDFIEDASGRLFVTFYFMNGEQTTVPYDDVIHVRMNYAVNQYMGGDELGQPNHEALLKTLELNKQLLTGVAKAMNASYAINGVIKYNSLLDEEKMAKAVAEFENKLANNASGFIPIDLKSDITAFPRTSEFVDEATLKFIDSKILRNFGVPVDILTGDYTKDQYEAFYQKTLEPIILAISQAFTKKLFTPREKAFGNKIAFYPKELIFLSMEQTIRMIEQLSPTGALFENEKRVALGLAPLPELEGKRYMSLNWIDANNAEQYQVGKINVDVVDKEEF